MAPRNRGLKPPAKLRPLVPKPLTANQMEINNIPWTLVPRLPQTFQQRGVVTEPPASFGGFGNSAATQNTGISHSSGQKRCRLEAPVGPDVAANFGDYPQQASTIPWTNSSAAPGFDTQYSSGQNPYALGGPAEPGITITDTPASLGSYGALIAAPRTSIPLGWERQPGPLRAPAGPGLAVNFSIGTEQMTIPTWGSSTAASEANFQPVSWENLGAPEVPIDPGIEATSSADEQQGLLAMLNTGSREIPAGAWGDPNVALTMGGHDLSEKARTAEFSEVEVTQKYQTSEHIWDQLFLAPINEFEEEYMGLKKAVKGPKRKINEISD